MRVAFVGIQTTELLTFRKEMLRAMVARGHTVLALAPEDDPQVTRELRSMRVAFEPIPLRRAGLSPIADSMTLIALTRILRRYHADAILVSAAKPIVYGSIAARLAGVPMRAAMVTGIGSALGGGASVRRRFLSRLLRSMYGIGLRHDHVIFFQNVDDERLFTELGLVAGSRQQIVQIAGSGIDIDAFTPAPLPSAPVTFLMVARLLRDKGLLEYIEAARLVRKAHPAVRFGLLGPLDPNPEGISPKELELIRREGCVEYLGESSDVRPFIAAAHVVVLPSYREGTPRSILEAMSMGRAILTTDVPGCRATVESGRNGLLVEPRSAESLADGMLELIDRADQLGAMGREGRQIVERRFDVRDVNRVILTAMGLDAVVPEPSHA